MLDPSGELVTAWQELHDAQTAFNDLDLSRNGLNYLNQTTIREVDRAIFQLNTAYEKFLAARLNLHDQL